MDRERIKTLLKAQRIETPAWGYMDSGTRFHVFAQETAARTIYEKLEDAAQVHRFTGICPSVAILVPWDKVDDWPTLLDYARGLGLELGSVNAALFFDEEYRLGSLCSPFAASRRKALDHVLECVDVARQIGCRILSFWLPDGTNYPGQDSFRGRKRRLEEALHAVCGRLAEDMRILIEYKFFEPAFYQTDIPDWGMAYLLSTKLGPKAQVLVDLGHHPLGTNIEQLVAVLLDEKKLGGFHFNAKKYADDDLTVGSINPYELFLIFVELIDALRDGETRKTAEEVAYMIDQSHNIKNKVEAMIQSVVTVQQIYAKALHVDWDALDSARREGRIIDAEERLKDAFFTDIGGLLSEVRSEMGVAEHPLRAFRESGYLEKMRKSRA